MIFVTGATGRVGRELVANLIDRGASVRAGTGNPADAGLPPEAETVALDLSEPATIEAALDGVDRVHLLWPFFQPGNRARSMAMPIADLATSCAGCSPARHAR